MLGKLSRRTRPQEVGKDQQQSSLCAREVEETRLLFNERRVQTVAVRCRVWAAPWVLMAVMAGWDDDAGRLAVFQVPRERALRGAATAYTTTPSLLAAHKNMRVHPPEDRSGENRKKKDLASGREVGEEERCALVPFQPRSNTDQRFVLKITKWGISIDCSTVRTASDIALALILFRFHYCDARVAGVSSALRQRMNISS